MGVAYMWPRFIGALAVAVVSTGWQQGASQTALSADERPIANFGLKEKAVDLGLRVTIDRDNPRFLTVVVSGNDKGPSPDKRLRLQIRFWDETTVEGTPVFLAESGEAGSYYRYYHFDGKRPLTLGGIVFLTVSIGNQTFTLFTR